MNLDSAGVAAVISWFANYMKDERGRDPTRQAPGLTRKHSTTRPTPYLVRDRLELC